MFALSFTPNRCFCSNRSWGQRSLSLAAPFNVRWGDGHSHVKESLNKAFRRQIKPLFGTFRRREIQIQSLSQEMPKAALWWEKDTDIWFDVNSSEALEAALVCPEYDLCVVDWYATWCHGCRKTAPILTDIAKDNAMNGRVRFIRACVDTMSDYARKQGVKSLPFLSIYDNKGNKILGFGAPASKAKTFQRNIQMVLDHPGKDFRLDPNGFALALDKVVAKEAKQEADRAVDELKNFRTSLAQKLVPAPSIPTNPPEIEDDDSIDEDYVNEKQNFLDLYGNDYGYGGKLHSTYEYELGRRLGKGQHYLDYTGSSVYTETQLASIMKDFRENTFGNPHSENPSSSLTRDKIEDVRRMILDFFDADPRNYQVRHSFGEAVLKTCFLGDFYDVCDGCFENDWRDVSLERKQHVSLPS